MAMTEDTHAARDLPEERRYDYLVAIASVVCADGEVAEPELAVLRTLCDVLALPPGTCQKVLDGAKTPDLARVQEILANFRDEPLRFALMTDAILVTYADNKVAAGESKEIAEFADALGMTTSQAAMIGRYVEEVVVAHEGHALSKALAEGLADAAAHVHPPRGVKWLYRKLKGK
jgi:uncharacterized tellurite resistance protein B-like protein